MNTVNPTALFRSLIVYAICVPLAILLGYLLTNPLDYQSMGFIGLLLAVLIFPLLMKWHYPLLVFSWGLPVVLFFLPGRPTLFFAMVAASLGISVVERILDRNQPFLPSSAVRWPLLAFIALIFLTAKLRGGFGLHTMGSEVYGGKKYIGLVIGILSFFAITARPIPVKHAKWYMTLYFGGLFFNALSDLYPFVPSPLHFIYLLVPASNTSMDEMGNIDMVVGQTRMGGVTFAAGGVWFWMLARHGFRGCFLTDRLWRPLLLGVMFVAVFLGGFRSAMIGLILITGGVFCLEKLYRSSVMLVLFLAGIMGAVLLVPLAPHLPFTFQRTLAFLPLDISPDARMDADGSTEWRIAIWKALLPEVPKYLLLGKGYAFSREVYDEEMAANAQFQGHGYIDAAQDPLALASDFHSGPLSTIIPFGIWGVLLWLWFWVAGFFVVWRNYRNGIPELQYINRFLFATFVVKIFTFLFIFGDLVVDMAAFSGVVGLSIALNHGIRQPSSKQDKAEPARPFSAGLSALAQ